MPAAQASWELEENAWSTHPLLTQAACCCHDYTIPPPFQLGGHW